MEDKIRDVFENLKADRRLVESTKVFLEEERKKREKPALFRAGRFRGLAAAGALLVLAAGIGGYSWLFVPVSYVSVDVNPSVELELNRLDRVVAAEAYNDDGEKVLDALSLKGKTYTDAIDALVESEELKIYLTEDAEITFTVAADGSRKSRLEAGVETCAGHFEYNSQSVSTDVETAAQAHDHHLSVGKYYAWLQLDGYEDNTVTVEDCRDMSISELHDLTEEHEKEHEYEHESEDAYENAYENTYEKESGHHSHH